MTTADTPMLRQFKALKADHQDAILFFRLGDFYEMFLDDATVASKELSLTLTGRGKDENRINMCGVPYHAADSYITKLVKKGYKVAICEQVEDPSQVKGLTKREVVRIVTPGTLIDAADTEVENNFLVGLSVLKTGFGFSFVDSSTGEFRLAQLDNFSDVLTQIKKLETKEVVVDDRCDETYLSRLPDTILVNRVTLLSPSAAEKKLADILQVHTLSSFGIAEESDCFPIAWGLLAYLKHTQKHALSQITACLKLSIQDHLQIDPLSLEHLNLVGNRTKEASLFSVLNKTKTAMGARRLIRLIKQPFLDPAVITDRLDIVEALKEDLLSREECREVLSSVYDIERLLSRMVSLHNNPRDLIALKHSLLAIQQLPLILDQIQFKTPPEFQALLQQSTQPDSPHDALITLISTGLIDDPPAVIRDGGMIRAGFHAELDTLVASFSDVKEWIQNLEATERERTGIKTLKVGFNKVFGYYFQISHSYKGPIPDTYSRKQTLANAERYISPELKEKELLLLNGEEQRKKLEETIYHDIVTTLQQHIRYLQRLSDAISELDCFQSLATVSQQNNYTRPVFSPESDLNLELHDCRHPILEAQSSVQLITNSLRMSKESNRFILITGPNMAGKSTLMRQVALCTIMAQMGCFVPARQAQLSVVDKLFTRIGASDDLFSGQSTFMVEMLEVASILHNASDRSLILLDEVGRGTSTYDGISIAGAITHYIHDKVGARTLFATHYHELTQLSDVFYALSNYNMAIKEAGDQLLFTYRFQPGPADKSYGIQVAKMAGLPDTVISEAQHLLKKLESHASQIAAGNPNQLSLF